MYVGRSKLNLARLNGQVLCHRIDVIIASCMGSRSQIIFDRALVRLNTTT